MRGIDITEWTAPLSQLTLLGLHTIGVGDGGNEIGMGRVEDYAIEGVVDHGENIACTVPTDQLVVAGIDGVHMTNVATVDGLEPDRYFKQVGQLTDCARS